MHQSFDVVTKGNIVI